MDKKENKNLQEIRTLLESRNPINIDLAYELSKGTDIDINQLLENDYKELYELFSIATESNIKERFIELINK